MRAAKHLPEARHPKARDVSVTTVHTLTLTLSLTLTLTLTLTFILALSIISRGQCIHPED
jgi:hypothetical protein